MKKLFALVLSVTLLATMTAAGLVLAAPPSVSPTDVNLVLPYGEIAYIDKTLEIGDQGTVDVWVVLEGDDDLKIRFDGIALPGDSISVDTTDTPTIVLEERINIRNVSAVDVGDILYKTVTFYYGDYTEPEEGTVIGTQEITASRGDLDIKPDSYPNSINCKKKGVTPVAILGVDSGAGGDFDVTTIDVGTIYIGTVAPLRTAVEDVNYDGADDLVCHFDTKALKADGVLCGDPATLTLSYELTGSDDVFSISDTVRTLTKHCTCPS